MKHIPSSKRILFSITLAACIIFSCSKQTTPISKQNLATDNLAFLFLTEKKIKVNQAITIYDSSQIKDSIDFVSPSSDKYYEWLVIPDNGCDSIIGEKNNAIAEFVFHCSGSYLLTAKIYDTLTNDLLGATDTLDIEVTVDTLYPAQPIKEDDVLNIQTGIGKVYSDTSLPPDRVYIGLNLSSTKFYDNYTPYIEFNYSGNISQNNYSYIFHDIRLNSYPFSLGPYGTTDKVWGGIELNGLSYGVPAKLSIIWLGITYTGMITLINENQYTYSWDNSGSVKMN